MLMQTVPQIWKNTPRNSQTRHFKRKIQYFSGQGHSPHPRTLPQLTPLLTPTKPSGSTSAFPQNSSRIYVYQCEAITHPSTQLTSPHLSMIVLQCHKITHNLPPISNHITPVKLPSLLPLPSVLTQSVLV